LNLRWVKNFEVLSVEPLSEFPDAAVAESTVRNHVRERATQNLVHWVLPQDAFIVIDYAATLLTVLKDWFAFASVSRHTACPAQAGVCGSRSRRRRRL
jgi:hypothetical protein